MAWSQTKRTFGTDAGHEDFYGDERAVAINGDGTVMVIGAPKYHAQDYGAAYVWKLVGGVWTEHQTLKSAVPGSNDWFGDSVAITDDASRIFIGVSGDDHAPSGSGSVFKFELQGDGTYLHDEIIDLGGLINHNLGLSIACTPDGDTLVCGCYWADVVGTNDGVAYIFIDSGSAYVQQGTYLQASDAGHQDHFGWAVDIADDGDTVLIGAPQWDQSGDNQEGACYVFVRSAGVWSQQARLNQAVQWVGAHLGYDVALSSDGNKAYCGAPQDHPYVDPSYISDAGAVFEFTRSGAVWTEGQKLTAQTPLANENFGWSVDISGDDLVLLVGAGNAGSVPEGKADFFVWGGSAWVWSQRVGPSDPVTLQIEDFGKSCALNGDGSVAVIGAPFSYNDSAERSGIALIFSDVAETGAPSLPIEQESYAATGQPELLLRQYSVERGTLALPLEQESHHPRGALSLPLRQISYAQGTVSLPIRQASIGLPTGTGDAGDPTFTLWRLIVMLDGIDISASLTGTWRVDAGEGVARIAEFSMMPAVGSIDPTTWVRKPVSIDYAETDSTGVVQWQARLFTGIVDVPEYDPGTRITRFLCTDRLQEIFEQSDPAAIDSQIGGYWSEHVFDAEADGWQRAQDRLSTLQASFDIDAGGATHLTDWAAKTTPDYTYTAAGHIDGSRRLELANSRDIHNRVLISFDFRFQRLRQRDIQRNWQMSPGVSCEYLQNPFTLPKRSMIQSAAEATGWALQFIGFVDLPPPQHFLCTPGGGGAPYVIGWGFKVVGNNSTIPNPAAVGPFCQGAYIKLGKRWAQAVTEEYQVDLRAPQSIGQIGEIAREDYGGVEAEQETDGWETYTEYTAPVPGALPHRNGDRVVDADQGLADGRSAMETAVQTLQAVHKTGILASHRRNFVAWRTLIQPQLEPAHTLRLQTTALTAKGKVAQLVHAGSIDTGEATTEIRLALSRSSATGALGDDPLDPPQAPDSQVDAVQDPTPSFSYGGAGMHIGGMTTSPPFDEDWTGLVTNYQWDPTIPDRFATDPDLPQTVVYPNQFRIQVPEIEEAARQAVEAQQTQTINIDIPLDQLQVA